MNRLLKYSKVLFRLREDDTLPDDTLEPWIKIRNGLPDLPWCFHFCVIPVVCWGLSANHLGVRGRAGGGSRWRERPCLVSFCGRIYWERTWVLFLHIPSLPAALGLPSGHLPTVPLGFVRAVGGGAGREALGLRRGGCSFQLPAPGLFEGLCVPHIANVWPDGFRIAENTSCTGRGWSFFGLSSRLTSWIQTA